MATEICVKVVPPFADRSILNPVSFDELSDHDKLTIVAAAAVANKFEAGLGTETGADVVVTSILEVAIESPAEFDAMIS